MSYFDKISGCRRIRGNAYAILSFVRPSAFSPLLLAALRCVCEVAIHLTRWEVQLVCSGSSPLRCKDEGNMLRGEKQGRGRDKEDKEEERGREEEVQEERRWS